MVTYFLIASHTEPHLRSYNWLKISLASQQDLAKIHKRPVFQTKEEVATALYVGEESTFIPFLDLRWQS